MSAISPARFGLLAAALIGLAAPLGHAGTVAPTYDVYTIGRSAAPIRPRPPDQPQSDAVRAQMQLKPLVADGAAPAVTTGLMNKGDRFFTIGVKHGVTGVLTGPVIGHGWFLSDKPLPAGQPVYGIPMAGSDGLGIVWCAPQSTPVQGGPAHWTAVCLPQNQGAFAWIVAKPALMTLDLSWPYGVPHTASAPSVQVQPVTFPPMTLSYAFNGWNKDHWLMVDVQIDWGEGPQVLRSIAIPPAADGSASLKVMGGEILIRPAPAPARDQVVVAVVSPPQTEAPIAY